MLLALLPFPWDYSPKRVTNSFGVQETMATPFPTLKPLPLLNSEAVHTFPHSIRLVAEALYLG